MPEISICGYEASGDPIGPHDGTGLGRCGCPPSPQEAGAPLAFITDEELLGRLNAWVDQYREHRDTSLNRYRVETLTAAVAAVKALASREAEVRRTVAAGIRAEADREQGSGWPNSAARFRAVADRVERGEL